MSEMERYLSPVLFAAEFPRSETLKSYSLTTARQVGFREDWLQDAISKNPELVLAACSEAGLIGEEEQWRFWAKEVSVPDCTGSIDLLLISDSGRVGIVETKLFYNPEARRAVVAQILEYAINLSSIIPHLPELPKMDGGGPFLDREDVLDRIQEGDYLLIIAGDQLDSRAVKLSEALLGKHLLRAWDLALVEVAVFEHQTDSGQKAHLLVPHIRGTIIPVRRQVVKIEIQGDRTRVDVSPLTPAASALTEEVLAKQIREKNPPELVQIAQTLLSRLKESHLRIHGLPSTLQYGVDVSGGFVPLVSLSAGNVWFQIPMRAVRALGDERFVACKQSINRVGNFYRPEDISDPTKTTALGPGYGILDGKVESFVEAVTQIAEKIWNAVTEPKGNR